MFNSRRYVLEMLGAFTLYGLLLVLQSWIHMWLQPAGGFALAVALIPMIGIVALVVAVMRGLWRMDELQQRIQLDALAFAFMVSALVTISWGFVETTGVQPLSGFALWPIMAGSWIAGQLIVRRRYR